MASRVPTSKPRRTGSLAIMNQAMQRRMPPSPAQAPAQGPAQRMPVDPRAARMQGPAAPPQQRMPVDPRAARMGPPPGGYDSSRKIGGTDDPRTRNMTPHPAETVTGGGMGMQRTLGQSGSQMDWAQQHQRQYTGKADTTRFNDRMMNAERAARESFGAQYTNVTPALPTYSYANGYTPPPPPAGAGETVVKAAPFQILYDTPTDPRVAPENNTTDQSEYEKWRDQAPAPAQNQQGTLAGAFNQFVQGVQNSGGTGTSNQGLKVAGSTSTASDTGGNGVTNEQIQTANENSDPTYEQELRKMSSQSAREHNIDPAYEEWLYSQGYWISPGNGKLERRSGPTLANGNGEDISPEDGARLYQRYLDQRDQGDAAHKKNAESNSASGFKEDLEELAGDPTYNQAEREAAMQGELEADRVALAEQQGRAMRMAMERGSRAGISPEAALANQGALQQQSGIAGMQQASQTRSRYAQQNLQLQIADSQRRYQTAMALWQRANTKEDRDMAIQMAKQARRDEQNYALQMQQLEDQITPGKVGGALAGALLPIAGMAAGAGVSSLLSPVASAAGGYMRDPGFSGYVNDGTPGSGYQPPPGYEPWRYR